MPLRPLLPPSFSPRTTWNIILLFRTSGIPAAGIHGRHTLEIKTYSTLTGRIRQLMLKGQVLDVEITLRFVKHNQLFCAPVTAAPEQPHVDLETTQNFC